MLNKITRALFSGMLLSVSALSASSLAVSSLAVNAAEQPIGININAMDSSVKPGDDFYGYANGNWVKTTEIPADRSSTGSFLVAAEATEKHKTDLIAELVKGQPAKGSDDERIVNFYQAYLDVAGINSRGMAPIAMDLARIDAISNLSDLSRALGGSVRADVDPLNATNYHTENLFGVFVTQGLATPGEVLPYLMQGGLGLPEREF